MADAAETRASGPAIMHVDVRPDRIAVVTLDDPSASANIVTSAFLSELGGVLERLRTDSGVIGAVVVSGKAESFVVGCDVARLQGFTLARDAEAAARAFAQLLAGLSGLGKPVVAAVHGPALGAGFELALACDQIVATDDACTAFGLPEARLGLLPAGNGLLRVAARAGVRVALDLGLVGEPKDAVTARRLGLVDEVCPRGVLLEIAATRARATTRARRPSARRAFEDNAVARRWVVSRARADFHTRRGAPSRALRKIVDVIERFGKSGFSAAAALEAKAFGELVVTEASRRLVEVTLLRSALGAELGSDPMPRSLVERGVPLYAARIHARYLDEARLLAEEGVPARAINAALVEWGWHLGPLAEGGDPTLAKSRPRGPAIEELQMRCILRLVNDALACLGERLVRDPADGDLGAILALGFPAFRGGPFRYVDAVGPVEILRRIRTYEARFGARFAPAPVLIERARTGERFYP